MRQSALIPRRRPELARRMCSFPEQDERENGQVLHGKEPPVAALLVSRAVTGIDTTCRPRMVKIPARCGGSRTPTEHVLAATMNFLPCAIDSIGHAFWPL